MSGIIDTTLPQLANQVRTATAANENDRERVGSLFEGIIDYIAQNEAAWLQDTGGGGGGSLSEPGALLKKLWLKGNPEAERILKYDGSDWVPIPVPSGGGSGGGMDVAAMWTALQSTTGDYANTKIPANHLDLTSCLKTNTTFWGNTANTTSNPNTVTGSLSGGIQFVEFSNNVKIGIDPNNPDTIRIYKDNNDSAHFYATGGVSALGYSSSGGGGGGGDTPLNLNYILTSINGSNNTVPTFDSALKYAVLHTNQGWQVLENTLSRLSNVQLNNNLSDGQALVYNSNGYWENRTVSSGGGTLSINGLDEVVNSFNSLSKGQVLTYSTSLGKWTNADLPTANGTGTNATMGIVKAGTGLSASSGTMSLTPATTTALGGIQIFGTVSSSITPQSGTTTHKYYGVYLDANNKAYVDVPWTNTEYGTATSAISGIMKIGNNAVQTTAANSPTTTTGRTYPIQLNSNGQAVVNVPWTDTTYEGGYGITVSSTLSSNNKYPISVDNGDGLTFAAGKLAIDDSYINGKWVTLNTQQIITATKTFTAHQILANNIALKAKDTGGNTLSIIEFGDNNRLSIGWNTTTGTYTYDTDIYGNVIKLVSGNEQNGKKQAVRVLPSGLVELALATTGPKSGNTYTGAGPAAGLKIGDAVLYWDEANQALALAKYNASTPSSPTAANFYATGGVSALGMSSGTGSVGAMTFGNLTVTTNLNTKKITTSDGNIVVNNSGIKLDGTNSDQFIDLDENSYIRFTCEDQGSDIKIILKSDTDGLYIKVGNGSYKKILTAS